MRRVGAVGVCVAIAAAAAAATAAAAAAAAATIGGRTGIVASALVGANDLADVGVDLYHLLRLSIPARPVQ